ncbi:MAG TPA: Ig-like domain-containing protein [Thermomicrobiales bacterium]|nr:Ig-like domain-containing protein [Thermomicrobiales bacterium]
MMSPNPPPTRILRSTRWTGIIIGLLVITAYLVSIAGARAGTDVAPGQTGFEPTSAVVNPRNPSQVAVARGCQVRISNDFGQTFPIVRNTTLGCNGDPSLAFDSQGRLFVTHLDRVGGDNELSVFAGQIADTTTTGTATYTPIQVSADDGDGDDKQWLVADSNPTSPYRDNLYIVWTELPPAGGSSVMFSRSTDSGANWSAQQVISAGGEGFVWPAHLAVAANGDLYVAYHTDTCGAATSGAIPILRDGNGGADFAAGAVNQKTNAFAGGEATVACNAIDGSGDEIPNVDFWLQGSVQPWILPDPLRAGNVYVIGNDDPNDAFASGDDGDVVIARSTDFGNTFSVSRVDHGPGQTLAVMPTAHIDQDGNIVVTWYDNRAGQMNTGANANFGAPNFLLELYGTTSRDGGQSFVNDFRISDNLFDPDANANCRFGALATNNCTARIGEYNGVWTVDGIAYAVWTGNAAPPSAPFPSDGAGAQTTMFDLFSMSGAFPDRHEPNESRDFAVAALLGANNTYTEDNLTLHTATDVDFFRVIALHTGKLDIEIEFNEVIAGLELVAQDRYGNQVATGATTTLQPGSSVERLTIPVVAGETYFVEVLDPNAPGLNPPQSTYGLTIVNTAAPAPFALDLLASSDSGRFDADNVTNDATATIQIRVDEVALAGLTLSPDSGGPSATDDSPGFKVAVYANGTLAGYATASGHPGTYLFTYAAGDLDEGLNSLTARVLIIDPSDDPGVAGTAHVTGLGGESAALHITLDTVAPATPAAPDLQAASDTGGISDDDITTLQTPTFEGGGEANSLVRVYANGGQTGFAVMSAGGLYQVATGPLNDGVYDVTATLEDLAGNISAASAALKVTIANQVLVLPGATASGPAAGPVTVDLGAGTIDGYPGIAGASGMIGIIGIPTVTFDVNGQPMTILGTGGDDDLRYTPTGADAGFIIRAGTSQTLVFSSTASPYLLDPLGGSDTVTVNGTTADDAVVANIDVAATITVNSLLGVELPTGNVERFGLASGQGADTIDVTAYDTVNASVLVDAADPSTTKPNADTLNVIGGSPKAMVQKQPGGPVAGSGAIFVTYPKTTGNATRVDYVNTERITTSK